MENENKSLPEYSTLEETRKEFSMQELVTFAKEGNLAEWLASSFFLGQSQKLLDVVESGGSDEEIFAILCRIFNLNLDELNDEDAAKISHSLDKVRARLNNKAAVVESQPELAKAVWGGADTVCLTGENLFYIPLGVTNKHFIGEENTVIEIFFDEDVDLDSKNITVENAQIFLRTPINLKIDNSKNVKIITGNKKKADGSADLSGVLQVLKGRSPFESVENYRNRAENCKGVAVGYVTLNSGDYNFDDQTFKINPTWDLKYIDVLRRFVAGKKFTLKIAPDVAEKIYKNERRQQIFADLTFSDHLTVASLYIETQSAGKIFIESWN